MWCRRRVFHFEPPVAAEGAPVGNSSGSDNAPWVTSCLYLSFPFDSEDEWRASSRWYELKADATSVSDSDDDEGGLDPIARKLQATPSTCELLVLGWSNGLFERRLVAPSSLRVVDDMDNYKIRVLAKHTSDVMMLSNLGTLVGAVSAEGEASISMVFPMEPLTTVRTIRLPHHHQAGLRCIQLWEGKESWQAFKDNDESSAVYCFVGDDVGRIRLWRVIVGEPTETLTSSRCVLIAVFGCLTFGSIGDLSKLSVDALGAPVAQHQTQPVFSMGLDDSNRLIAGGEKRLFVWSLEGVDRIPAQGCEWNTVDDGLQRSTSAGGIHSRYFDKWVWLTTALEEEKSCSSVSSAQSKRLASVVKEVRLGHVINIRHSHRNQTYEVSFPHLKRSVEAELASLHLVEVPILSCVGDANGPVFSIAVLHEGLMLTGGSSGALRLWHWSSETCRYELLHEVQAHRDLIKSVSVVATPSVFISASLDGTVRMWKLGEKLKPIEVAAVACVAPDDEDEAHPVAHFPGVAAAVVHPGFGALFVLQQWTNTLCTYVFLEVDGCMTPPNLIFDGTRTIPFSSTEGENNDHVDGSRVESGDTQGLQNYTGSLQQLVEGAKRDEATVPLSDSDDDDEEEGDGSSK